MRQFKNTPIFDRGGVSNYGRLTVTQCYIIKNRGSNSGGIYNNGTLTITNSNINQNTADGDGGGGIYNHYGTFTLNYSNVKSNTARNGGAIYNSQNLLVTGCDFESNKAKNNGNAVYNYGTLSSTVVHSSLFNDLNSYEIYCESGSVDATGNWWGSNSNPSNKIYGNVTTSPWLSSYSLWQEYAKRLSDLVVQSITAPTAGYNGKTISITNIVKNTGSVAVGKFYTRFYLSKDNKYSSKDIYLGQRIISSLKAGATSTAKTSLKIPTKTGKGTYYLIAIADATQLVKELSKTNNNKYSGKISIQSRPDLIITKLTTTTTREKTIKITNSIKNTGTVKAGKFYTKFYLSKDNKYSSKDIYLGQRTISSLKAGVTSTAKTSLKIPLKTAKGTYYIIAVTDATKKVKESIETNNKHITKKTTIN